VFRRAVLTALAAMLAALAQSWPAQAARGCESCHTAHRHESRSCPTCHRGDPTASRKELAHRSLLHGRAAALTNAAVTDRGASLVRHFACRRCHQIGAAGNRLATSLDRAVWTRSQQELEAAIEHPVDVMPRFGATHRQVEDVIAHLLSVAERSRNEERYRVQFDRRERRALQFETHCGGCHRALLATGPAGRGSAGPNLSGLLSTHYPATAPGDKPWTRQAITDWLRNPRAARRTASMRPMRIPERELAQLFEELR
jgi:mono/diheme cytochrome c family protein